MKMNQGTCMAPDGTERAWSMSQRTATIIVSILGVTPLLMYLCIPRLLFLIGGWLGNWLKTRNVERRRQILEMSDADEKTWWNTLKTTGAGSAEDWERFSGQAEEMFAAERSPDFRGVIGFLHPFCNAGGGGERVLWAAIRATQQRYKHAQCVVYTGDHEADKTAILSRVKNRFNIHLHPPTVTFLYLTTRSWVLASSWPRFTLLGQSIGSLVMAWDAFTLLTPDIFVDTMGYAFALGFSKVLFQDIPTGAYVHYPTISTDMLGSLDSTNMDQGLHAGKGMGVAGKAKKIYWQLFAYLYSFMGASIDVVMTNSTWTNNHITLLWGDWRKELKKGRAVTVYPPVAVEEVEEAVEVSEKSEKQRQKALLYIAQFRPEKNHTLIMNSFAEFVQTSAAAKDAKLVLIGSVRDDHDAKRVYQLRLLANELKIKDRVEFHLDASWPEILDWLRKASVGVNGMWNEHFGIGVVEYQAAGLISVVHDSAGPKMDIVVDVDGQPTGYHATTATQFAQGFEKALSLGPKETLAMRRRARKSAQRFTEEEFAQGWLRALDELVAMREVMVKKG